MIKVNGKESLKKISSSSLKANKKRNIVFLLAVILTTFLISTIFNIGISYMKSTKERNLRMSGIDWSAYLESPTEEQYHQILKMKNTKYAGLQIGIGTFTGYRDASEGDFVSRMIPMRYADTVCFHKMMAPAKESITGSYPKKKNEIMPSNKTLSKLGIKNPKVGDKLTFTYEDDRGEHTETFILSGFYKDYTGKQNIFVSKALMEESGTKVYDSEGVRLYIGYKNPIVSEKESRRIEDSLNLHRYQVFFSDTSYAYMAASLMAGMAFVIFVIMLCGYLIIYNIMNISINGDIQYFGLLKTIGVTGRQIKSILRRQIRLCLLLALPAGLILGAITTYAVSGNIMRAFGGSGQLRMSFHPLIYLGAAFFSTVTVLISARKPLKIAAACTPIEAARYLDVGIKRRKKGDRNRHNRSNRRISAARMAFTNIFREKKQAVIVFLSLTAGLTAFVLFYTNLSTNGGDNVLENLGYDVEIRNETMKDIFKNQSPSQVLTADLIQQIEEIQGVKSISAITANKDIIDLQPSLMEFFEKDTENNYRGSLLDRKKSIEEHPEENYGFIGGIDEEEFDSLKDQFLDPVNKEKFFKGEFAIITSYRGVEESQKSILGKSVKFTVTENRQPKEASLSIAARMYGGITDVSGTWPDLIVCKSLAKKLVEQPTVSHLHVRYDKSYDSETEDRVKSVISGNHKISYESKIDRYHDMNKSESELKLLGGGMVLVLAFMGLMNFINMMVTSISRRKRELAVLQSIGMTSRQLYAMLSLEGAYYGGISLILSAVLGLTAGYVVYLIVPHMPADFKIPYAAIAVFFFIILTICVTTPIVIYRKMKNASIIDQLRMD